MLDEIDGVHTGQMWMFFPPIDCAVVVVQWHSIPTDCRMSITESVLVVECVVFYIDRMNVGVGMDRALVICSPMLALERCWAIGVTTGKSVHDSHLRQDNVAYVGRLLNLRSHYH